MHSVRLCPEGVVICERPRRVRAVAFPVQVAWTQLSSVLVLESKKIKALCISDITTHALRTSASWPNSMATAKLQGPQDYCSSG